MSLTTAKFTKRQPQVITDQAADLRILICLRLELLGVTKNPTLHHANSED